VAQTTRSPAFLRRMTYLINLETFVQFHEMANLVKTIPLN
jgi:hypothetical protein